MQTAESGPAPSNLPGGNARATLIRRGGCRSGAGIPGPRLTRGLPWLKWVARDFRIGFRFGDVPPALVPVARVLRLGDQNRVFAHRLSVQQLTGLVYSECGGRRWTDPTIPVTTSTPTPLWTR